MNIAGVTEAQIRRARELLAPPARVLVLTGAGLSAESGVPTFRGPTGLWKRYRPEELATPEAFSRDPRLVWEWYTWRRDLISSCAPNPAHEALGRWLPGHAGRARLATQNVDGLHTLAQGTGAPPPLELHGSLFRVRCTACGHQAEHREPVDASGHDTLPRCPRTGCDALLRPAVVWFGEALPGSVLSEAIAWAQTADCCLVVGTSALVHPAASLPRLTLDSGGAVVEVNLEPTPLTPTAVLSLRAPAGHVLPRILDPEG